MLRRAVSLASRMGSGAVHQGVPTRAVASTGAKAVVSATAGAWSDTGSHHAWATVAAALGACAVVGAGVAACEHGLSPLEKAVVAGDASTGEGAVDAAATDLVSDSLEADVLDEKRERYKKHMKTPLLLISGTAHKELAGQIASELYEVLVEASVGRFADGEVQVELGESVRGCDVYLVQPTCAPVNDNIMELLLLVSTLRRNSAKRITAVIPYYGYKRDVGKPESEIFAQEATHEHGRGHGSAIPISAADVALMLETMGVDRVISVDLQPPGHGQIQGFFPSHVAVDSLRSVGLAVAYFAKQSLRNVVVVSPNEACMQLACDLQTGLMRASAKGRAAFGLREVGLAALVQGGHSRGMDRYAVKGDASETTLLGDVKGADVILVDDMLDSGTTLRSRVQLLKDSGARRVFAFATHGLFTGNCIQNVEMCGVEKFVVTDTVPLKPEVKASSKVVQLSVAPLLATAIKRLHRRQSLQDLRVYSRTSIQDRYAGQNS